MAEQTAQSESPPLSEKDIEAIKKQRKPAGIIYSRSLPKCSNCGTVVRVPDGKIVECLSCGELLKSDDL